MKFLVMTMLLGLALPVQADEQYTMVGYVRGAEIFQSPEPKPSSPVFVSGVTTDEEVFLGGKLEIELQLMKHWQGVATGLHWDLGNDWFVIAGSGVGHLNADLDFQDDGFNFILQGGVGRKIGDWRMDLRIHHISNARLREPNTGTNGVLLLFGRTW